MVHPVHPSLTLKPTKQGYQNVCILHYPVSEGTNIFDDVEIYKQKRAVITDLIEDAIKAFYELHECTPTTIYIHGGESGILRGVLQNRREEWEKDKSKPEWPRVDSYGDYKFREIQIKEGCNMQRGVVLLIYWEPSMDD